MTNEHKRAPAAEVDPDGMFERAYAEAAGVAHEASRPRAANPQTEARAIELSGSTGELIDRIAEAIRGDTTSDDTPWATLSEDRKIGWRGDAERALAVVKDYLTARRPAEQAVTDEMVEAAQDAWEEADNDTGDLDACWRAALKAAMEAGR